MIDQEKTEINDLIDVVIMVNIIFLTKTTKMVIITYKVLINVIKIMAIMGAIRKTSITAKRTTAMGTIGATSTPVTRITVTLATIAIILTTKTGTTTIIPETTNVIMTTGDKTLITITETMATVVTIGVDETKITLVDLITLNVTILKREKTLITTIIFAVMYLIRVDFQL